MYLLKAIRLQPEEAVIIYSIGWLRFKQGRMDESLKYLRDAYTKQKEGEIAAHLVEVLWTIGSKGEAKEIYQQAIIDTPDNKYLIKVKQRLVGVE